MLLCMGLDVSATAAKVAAILAFHGWTSWPSRPTIAKMANAHPNLVSKVCKELEDSGIITRRRRYHKGGNVGIQYTFNGDALVTACADQQHPTLSEAISALNQELQHSPGAVSPSEPPRSDPPPKGATHESLPADTPPPNSPQDATHDSLAAHALPHRSKTATHESLPAPQTSTKAPVGANHDSLAAQPAEPGRDSRFVRGATHDSLPEPEVIEPEGVTLTDEINQSNSGSSDSNVPSTEKARPQDELPRWYKTMARQLDPAILLDFDTLHETAMLAGWTEKVMDSTARLYATNYRNQRVNNPTALFKKLAIQEASKAPAPPASHQSKYSQGNRPRRPNS